jgi:hypothetical protein
MFREREGGVREERGKVEGRAKREENGGTLAYCTMKELCLDVERFHRRQVLVYLSMQHLIFINECTKNCRKIL